MHITDGNEMKKSSWTVVNLIASIASVPNRPPFKNSTIQKDGGKEHDVDGIFIN